MLASYNNIHAKERFIYRTIAKARVEDKSVPNVAQNENDLARQPGEEHFAVVSIRGGV